ncbi:MAG: NADP-dependent malic enzyme [Polyangiaceae bacterium]
MSHYEQSLTLHQQTRGKWAISSRVALETQGDLSVAYTPGVARVSEVVSREKHRAYELTMKGNTVAIVSDGTAVLGLGNIGPEGALPVMEGKAVLFKRFADVDAVPIVLDTTDPQRIIETVRAIAPTFGGINLEDIAAPACFRIERELQDIGIPVFHDDQDGTAIVLLAALENAARVVGKRLEDLSVVINGAGAAGTAIARLLRCVGHDRTRCQPVRSILVCDSKGIVSSARTDLNDEKRGLLTYSNPEGMSGSLRDALIGADVFIGVSKGNLLDAEDVALMGRRAIVFAMANPVPEITPDEARRGGAAVIGTGRSDYPNQVNNVLAFPGVFRGALDARATRITAAMKLAAAHALASLVESPTAGRVLPTPFEPGIAEAVATAVREAAIVDGVSRI